MDPARAAILEAAWRAVLKRKRESTMAIVGLRATIRQPGTDVHKTVEKIREHEARIALLDEIVAEASCG